MAKTKKTEATSTALTVLTVEEQAYLDSLKTKKEQDEYAGPNKLTINTQAKDADGNRRPIGGWHIQGANKYYDGVIRFRPVRHAYKLIRYSVDDANNYTVAGQSIYFKDFNEDILDSLGGTCLGRKFGRSYSDEEKEATKKLAECYLDIFGFVSFPDEEPRPVMYRVRGSKLMKMINAFRAIPKDKYFSEYEYELETFQPEGKQYWDINVTPDLSTKLPVGPVLAFDAEVQQFITDTNLEVISEHKKHKAKEVTDTMAVINGKTVKAEIVDDELPF